MNDAYRLMKKQGKDFDPNQVSIFKARAIQCLDFSAIDSTAVENIREQRAVLLSEILDRIELPPPETIPDAAQITETKFIRWRIPHTEIAIVQVADGPRQGDFLFSSDTVKRVPEFYERVKHLPYRSGTVLENAFDKVFTSATPAVSEADQPLRPADTSSPRATLTSFVDNVNEVYRSFKAQGMDPKAVGQRRDSRNRALRCLDLSQVPPNVLDEIGVETAVLLMEVLDRVEVPPSEHIPGAKDVKDNHITSWTIPNTEITIAQVQEGPRKGEFLFSSETVNRAEEFYDHAKALPYKEGTVLENAYHAYLQAPGSMVPISWVREMPPWLKSVILGQPVWKWIALVGVLLLVLFGLVLAFRFRGRKQDDARPAPFYRRVLFPLSAIALGLLGEAALEQIHVIQQVRFFTSVLFTLILAVGIAWLIAMFNNVIAELIVASPRINAQSIDAQMVRVAFRIVTLIGFVIVILEATASLGIPLTPVLAGLGVGGIAIALAAQNTLENLLGGFNLFMDRPIRVGDFCRFGDRVGTIEEIGMRSTRVRTLDDTVVSVPNATFSKMELENYSQRRKIWYHPRIQLDRKATPDQVRFVLVEVRKMLYSHPRVDPSPARIRFTEFGASSLDLDVFAYVNVADYGEFLEVAEDLNLRIMDILAGAQVSLAVPIQRTLIERVEPHDPQRVEETEKQVAQWRENNQLYLPSFPEEVVAELRETLDYPPRGSPAANAKECLPEVSGPTARGH
jgi:MscS family membrane protein